MWVMYGKFSEELKKQQESRQVNYLDKLYHHKEDSFIEETQIFQFYKHKHHQPYHPEHNYLLQTEEDYAVLNKDLATQRDIGYCSKTARAWNTCYARLV